MRSARKIFDFRCPTLEGVGHLGIAGRNGKVSIEFLSLILNRLQTNNAL